MHSLLFITVILYKMYTICLTQLWSLDGFVLYKSCFIIIIIIIIRFNSGNIAIEDETMEYNTSASHVPTVSAEIVSRHFSPCDADDNIVQWQDP